MDHPEPELPPSAAPLSLAPAWLALGDVQRLLLETNPGIVLGLSPDGRIRWINGTAAERLGYGRQALNDKAFVGDLVAQEELELRAAQLTRELGEHVPAEVEAALTAKLRRGWADEYPWVLRHKDGAPLPTPLALIGVRGDQGQLTGLIAVAPLHPEQDDTALQLTHHDSLTGLPARAVLQDRAEMAIQRAARQHTVLALMLIELEGFDTLCETLGHTVGDDVLRAVAGRLHFELRKTDTAVRLDRGQFAAMLVDLHHADEARLVANKIHQALSAPVNVGVARLQIPVRIGVAWFPSHGDQLWPLLQAAEACLADLRTRSPGVVCAPLAED